VVAFVVVVVGAIVVVVVVDAFVVGVVVVVVAFVVEVVVVVDAFVVGVTDVAFLARVVHDMSERDSDSISRTDEKTITKRFLSFIIPPF